MSDKHSFTDWILDLPIKTFFLGSVLIMFCLWCIVTMILLIYLFIANHS